MYEWERDQVVTRGGVVVPVRGTSRRPTWVSLPPAVRAAITRRVGAEVESAWSAGTGFTPGFASRLTLVDGRDVFVKAASSADDREHGWPLSDAYRDEVRKLRALPPGIGAPPLLWSDDTAIDGEQWTIAAFAFIDGAPPRRPWRLDQLSLVLDKLAAVAAVLTPAPPGFELDTVEDVLLEGIDAGNAAIRSRDGDSPWQDDVDRLCAGAGSMICGESLVHMDLREDNLLVDADGEVWIVDWNWPVVGAAWIDLICVLLSVRGDGLDAEGIVADHALTHDVDPVAVDTLLAVVWSYWAVNAHRPSVPSSPHLRDHQRWYLDVTRDWLAERLTHR